MWGPDPEAIEEWIHQGSSEEELLWHRCDRRVIDTRFDPSTYFGNSISDRIQIDVPNSRPPYHCTRCKKEFPSEYKCYILTQKIHA